jgi:hypothetical protein
MHGCRFCYCRRIRCWSRNLEANYQATLRRAEESASLEKYAGWLREFPYREMAQLGWIDDCSGTADRIRCLLEFFAVASVEAWEELWVAPQVAFRKSRLRHSSPSEEGFATSVLKSLWGK